EVESRLHALGADHQANRVHTPAGVNRAGADVGLAQRRGVGTPGGARTQIAPHDRQPQLVADHCPRGCPGAGNERGNRRASQGFRSQMAAPGRLGLAVVLWRGATVLAGPGMSVAPRPSSAVVLCLGAAVATERGLAVVPPSGPAV